MIPCDFLVDLLDVHSWPEPGVYKGRRYQHGLMRWIGRGGRGGIRETGISGAPLSWKAPIRTRWVSLDLRASRLGVGHSSAWLRDGALVELPEKTRTI